MKAKHILFALALPAVFAACSQDELIAPNEPATGITGVELGYLNFNVVENPNTRLAIENGKPVWADTDKIGLVWVSNHPSNLTSTGGAGEVNDFSTLAEAGKVLSNHPLYNENGKFQSKTMIFEGQYWACFPYQADLTSTEKLSLPLKETQELDFTDAESDVLKENTYFLTRGATIKLKKDEPTEQEAKEGVIQAGIGNTLPIVLDAFSNRLLLNISVKGTDEIKAEDVVVKAVTMTAENSNTGVLRKKAEFDFTQDYPGALNESYSVPATDFYLSSASDVAKSITVKNTSSAAIGTTKKFTTIISYLPTNLTAIDNLEFVIETNYGDITYKTIGISEEGWKKGETAIAQDGVATDFIGLSTKIGSYAARSFEIDMKDASITEKTAKDAQEIMDIVSVWKKTPSPVALTIKLVNGDTYKDAQGTSHECPVYLKDLVLENLPAKLTLESNDAQGILFQGTSKIASEVEIKNGNSNTSGTVTVEAGATLDIVGEDVDITAATTVDEEKDKDNKVIAIGYLNVYNGATLDITGALINKGQIILGTADTDGIITFTTQGSSNDASKAVVIVKNGSISAFGTGHEGVKKAVVSNALAFASVIKDGVTDVEVNGVITLGAVTLDPTNAANVNITIATGGSLQAGKTATFKSLTIAANTTLTGEALITVDDLNIEKSATLTIAEKAQISTTDLAFPVGSAIVVNGSLTYTSANPAGGSLSGTGKVNGANL
mgnify:CR=1 FL=1